MSPSSNWKLSNDKLLLRDQVAKVLGIVKRASVEDYVFFASCANLGFRISEVMHLKVEDVRGSEIMVTRRKKKTLEPEPVHVGQDVLELLGKVIGRRRVGWLWPGESRGCSRPRQKGGKVYAREEICQGGHLSKREIQRRWTRYVEKAKLTLRGRGVHALRHYAITEFYRVYRDLRATQVLAGHSASSTTEQYAHVVDMTEKIDGIKPVL